MSQIIIVDKGGGNGGGNSEPVLPVTEEKEVRDVTIVIDERVKVNTSTQYKIVEEEEPVESTGSSFGAVFYSDIIDTPNNPYNGKRMQFWSPKVEGSDFTAVANEGFSSNANGQGITDYTVTIPKSTWNQHLWLVDITIYSSDNAGWYFVTQEAIDSMTSNRLNFYGLALHSSSKRNPNNTLYEQHRLQTIVAGADFSESFVDKSMLGYTTGDGDITFRIYSVDNNNDISNYSTVDTASGEGYRGQSKIQITKIR